MLAKLLGFFSPIGPIYVRVSPEMLYVRNLKTGLVFDEPATLAVKDLDSGRPELQGIGQQAHAVAGGADMTLLFPFKEPLTFDNPLRTMDVLVAEAVRQVRGDRSSAVSPLMVIQWIGETPLSDLNKERLKEVGLFVGARKTFVVEGGSPLTDEEVTTYN